MPRIRLLSLAVGLASVLTWAVEPCTAQTTKKSGDTTKTGKNREGQGHHGRHREG